MNVTAVPVELERLRVQLFEPKGVSAKRPAVLAYSDIFQLTAPHVRMCTRIASYGFTVIAPELYGRTEARGSVYRFEEDRQKALDASQRLKLAEVDEDIDAALAYAKSQSPVVYACGWCIGGHVAFRAAMRPEVVATACFYATGLHSNLLGGAPAPTLDHATKIRGDLLLVWGGRDPHIPAEGRQKIHGALAAAGTRFQTRTYDAEHTFMRDEGARWEPKAADAAFHDMLSIFH